MLIQITFPESAPRWLCKNCRGVSDRCQETLESSALYSGCTERLEVGSFVPSKPYSATCGYGGVSSRTPKNYRVAGARTGSEPRGAQGCDAAGVDADGISPVCPQRRILREEFAPRLHGSRRGQCPPQESRPCSLSNPKDQRVL